MLLEAGYTGAKGTGFSVNFASPNMLREDDLRLGAGLLERVDNPLFGVITDPSSPLSKRTVARNQLLRPFPQFRNMSLEKGSYASSTYHALQVRMDRRFANGFTFLASYTASKLIDDSSTSGTGLLPPYAFIQQWHNRRANDRFPSRTCQSGLCSARSTNCPSGGGASTGAGMSRLADFLVVGWQVNGIWTLSRGTPLILVNA